MVRALLLGAFALPVSLLAQTRVASLTTTPDGAPIRVTATAAQAVRASTTPVLDGKGDDAVWASAPEISAFRQFEPVEDGDPKEQTTARVAFDERNLYVLMHATDAHPDSIVGQLTRRDQRSPSDWLMVLIDSYNDKRTGYEFHVNPAGVKRDITIVRDGEEDSSWDGVWDVATHIDSDGWTAEFRIPLSQLRFPPNGSPTFGMMFIRNVGRSGERLAWPVLRKSKSGLVSQFAEVSGFDGLTAPRRLEVTPYTVMKSISQSQLDGSGSVTGYDRANLSTVGADIKYGITSNLTLDATVNPDFGQVEADPSNLNLTAFETFYSERRPFFMEGAGLFRFDLNCNDGTCSGLFYSRRIGRRPQLTGTIRGIDPTASVSTSTPILGAAKLTGRTESGLQIGMFDAMTDERKATGRTIGTVVAEPRTNYLVGRIAQDFRQGKSTIGVMATSVNRSLDDFTETYLTRSAMVGGLDARHRFWNANYEVAGFVAASTTTGSKDAISSLQLSSRHQYDRVDGDLTFDSTRTKMTGTAEQLTFNKVGGGISRFNFNYRKLSPGFEVNDVGYLSRADQQSQNGWVGLQFNTPTKLYRMARLNFNQWQSWSAAGLRSEFGGNVNGHVQLPSQWWLHTGISGNNFIPTYDDRVARGGPAVRTSPNVNGWFGFEGDSRKRITPYVFVGGNRGDVGNSKDFWIDPKVDVRISDQMMLSGGPYYENWVNDNQWVGTYTVNGSNVGTFAHLNQKTLSITGRMDYTATPTLTMQLYFAPYVTVGEYQDHRMLNKPRAARYADRFTAIDVTDIAADQNFNYRALNTNAVLRWEYRPGSALFVVWQQGREDFLNGERFSSFRMSRDYSGLFTPHPDNTFLVKASYWFSL
jgi:hypothetical protein